jgi:hypothetical protein
MGQFQVIMRRAFAIMSLLSSVALTACSVVGIRSGTEEPRYTVLQRQGALEIREYGPRLAAETTVDGSELSTRSAGFQRLAGYIFGANHGGGKIAMTAPVAQAGPQTVAMTAPVVQDETAPGEWRIRFFMPAQYTLDTLPQPNNPAVHIVTVPAQTMAVYRYTGSIDAAATTAARRELSRLLEGSGWTATGQPVSWFYDPPWTLPFLRRNEAAVPVARPAAG